MIQAVSGKQIAEFTRRLLASKPSLAAFGDGTEVLDYDALVQRFSEGKWGQRASNPLGPDTQSVFEKLKQGLVGGRGMASSSGRSGSSSGRSRYGSINSSSESKGGSS
jgi:hypothetical protein